MLCQHLTAMVGTGKRWSGALTRSSSLVFVFLTFFLAARPARAARVMVFDTDSIFSKRSDFDLGPIAGRTDITKIAGGHFSGWYGDVLLALTATGRVLAVGHLDDGERVPVPDSVTADNITDIAAGNCFAMALSAAGRVYVWGTGNPLDSWMPAAAKSGVKAFAAGFTHAMALLHTGEVIVWGVWGPSYYDNPVNASVPAVAAVGVASIAAGNGWSAVIKQSGELIAFDKDGLLDVPAAASPAATIVAGSIHGVVRTTSGQLVTFHASRESKCRGNYMGYLEVPPPSILFGWDIVAVAAGDGVTYGITSSGRLVIFGGMPPNFKSSPILSHTLLAAQSRVLQVATTERIPYTTCGHRYLLVLLESSAIVSPGSPAFTLFMCLLWGLTGVLLALLLLAVRPTAGVSIAILLCWANWASDVMYLLCSVWANEALFGVCLACLLLQGLAPYVSRYWWPSKSCYDSMEACAELSWEKLVDLKDALYHFIGSAAKYMLDALAWNKWGSVRSVETCDLFLVLAYSGIKLAWLLLLVVGWACWLVCCIVVVLLHGFLVTAVWLPLVSAAAVVVPLLHVVMWGLCSIAVAAYSLPCLLAADRPLILATNFMNRNGVRHMLDQGPAVSPVESSCRSGFQWYFLAHVALACVPQLVLQVVNNSLTDSWPPVAVASIAITCFVAVNIGLRFAWHVLVKGQRVDEVPFGVGKAVIVTPANADAFATL